MYEAFPAGLLTYKQSTIYVFVVLTVSPARLVPQITVCTGSYFSMESLTFDTTTPSQHDMGR